MVMYQMTIHFIFWIPNLHIHIALFDPSPPVLNKIMLDPNGPPLSPLGHTAQSRAAQEYPRQLQGTVTAALLHRDIAPAELSISATTAILFWDWNLLFQLKFPQRVQQAQTHIWYSNQGLLLGVSKAFLNISWTAVFVCCPYLLFLAIMKLFLRYSWTLHRALRCAE